MKWEIENQLARSWRPGHPSRNVGRESVDLSIIAWKAAGIRSIICLLSESQLAYYDAVPQGLLEAYRKAGFTVNENLLHSGLIRIPRHPWQGPSSSGIPQRQH